MHGKRGAGLAVAIWGACCVSHAVVVNTTPAANTNAPADDPGWDAVGRIGGGSGVYVGGNWVLTAYHIKQLDNPTLITFGASTYGLDASSWTRITNATGGDADLVMVRTTTTPAGITAPVLRTTSLPGTAAVTAIGYGRTQYPSNSYWSVDTSDPNDWSWTRVGSGDAWTHSGFETSGTRTKRWGNNASAGYVPGLLDDGFGLTRSYYTVFDSTAGADEEQGVIGDSGGGIFYKQGSAWQLAGIPVATSGYNNQPGGSTSALYGNRTYIADVSTYAGQISQVIPEPFAAWLFAGGVLGFRLLARYRHRKRAVLKPETAR